MTSYEAPPPRPTETAPHLDGRNVSLRAVRPTDYDYLYALSLAPDNIWTWRQRGSTPGPDVFRQSLWQGVLAQFMIVKRPDGPPVGLVSAYAADFRNDIVYLAIVVDPAAKRTVWALEGAALLLTYLFTTWSFRKVYMETLEFNYGAFASGAGTIFSVEGCLLEYEYHDGKYWHKYIMSISRSQWEAVQPSVDMAG